jgi:glycosyltransferase involved in cell wall biosynthesis
MIPGPVRFTVVTSCRNAERLVGDTVAGILGQTALRSGRATLEYLVCDGASTDGTLEVVRSFDSPHIAITSRPDSGMYEALSRGLQSATGDWIGYANAGDILSRTAFDAILDALQVHDAKWITGLATESNEAGELFSFTLPFKYRRSLIRAGQYARRAPCFLPWIQQESTFWNRSLHATVDWDRLATLKLAGDAYLWTRFAREADLTIVAAHLGGFRRHAGQLSEDMSGYRAELDTFAERAPLFALPVAFFDNLLWYTPPAVKKAFNPYGMIVFDRRTKSWR